MEIFNAMLAILTDIDAIAKKQKNTKQGYSFRGIDDMVNGFHPLFAKHGIFILPEILEEKREDRPTKDGTGIIIATLLKIKYTFYCKDGSSLSAIIQGEGMDSGDKSSNKAMSAALKYLLIQTFLVPTEDIADADKDSPEIGHDKKQEEKEQQRLKLESTLSENVKEGFRILGYGVTAAYVFCERFGWEEGKIMAEINKIIDSKKA